MRRALLVGALVTVALAGCGWTQVDFDSGRSRADGFETKITAATAGSLQLHSIPLTASPSGAAAPNLQAVVGNQIVVQQGNDVVAYDAATCPHSDNGPCTPLWIRTSSQFEASDGGHFVFTSLDPNRTSDRTFTVTDAARPPLWQGEVPELAAPATHVISVVISGDKVVAAGFGGEHGSFSEELSVFPIGGCGAPTCAPLHSFDNGSDTHGGRWVASGDTLVVTRAPNMPLGLYAFDMTTGALRWSAPGDFELNFARVRGRDLYVSPSIGGPPVSVYDLAGQTGCNGAPAVCTPLRVLDPAPGFLYWESTTGDRTATFDSVQDAGGGLGTHTLSFFAADGTGCGASPCAPLATSAPVTTWVNEGVMRPVTAGDLVLALGVPAGISNRTYHLLAYDAHLSAGCSGTPTVCRPVADVKITGQSDAQPAIAAVWNGRVYIQITGRVLVLSLPGDVS